MDINQQLEYLNLSADVLTESDVISRVTDDKDKLVTAHGINTALQTLSAAVSSRYATKVDVEAVTCNVSATLLNYQLSGDYLSANALDGYATEQFVISKGYLRQHQSLADYCKKSETSSAQQIASKITSIDAAVSKKLDSSTFTKTLEKYVPLSDLEGHGFISSHQSLSDYYKKDELSTAAEIDACLADYYTKPSLYTKSQVNEIVSKLAQTSSVCTREWLEDLLKQYAKKSYVSSKVDLDEAIRQLAAADSSLCAKLQDYATIDAISTASELSDAFAKLQKSGDYALSSDVSSAAEISEELKRYVLKDDSTALVEQLSQQIAVEYAKKEDVPTTDVLAAEIEKCQPKGDYAQASAIAHLEQDVLEAVDSLDSYALKSEVSSAKQVAHALSGKQPKGDYAYLSDIVSATAAVTTSLSGYALSSDVSSQLARYALRSSISTASDLAEEFAKYQRAGKYALLSDVTKTVSSMTSGYAQQDQISTAAQVSAAVEMMALSSDVSNLWKQAAHKFALSSDVSSKAQLEEAFAKLCLSSDVYSREELDKMLSRYALSGTSYTIGETQQLLKDKYAPLSKLSSYVLANQLSAYANAKQVSAQLQMMALSSDVSSAADVSAAFKQAGNDFKNAVRKDISSSVSANIELRNKTMANWLSAQDMYADFRHIKNTVPMTFLSSVFEAIDESLPIGIIANRINYFIIDAQLDIPLLDIDVSSGASTVEQIQSTINKICQLLGVAKLEDADQLKEYVPKLNVDIEKVYPNDVSSFNVQQALSAIGAKLSALNNAYSYTSDFAANLANQFERTYSMSQTSSAYEIKKALESKQPAGQYVSYDDLQKHYAKQSWVIENFMPIASDDELSVNAPVLFQDSTTFKSGVSASSMRIDFAKLYDCKSTSYLSGYLMYVQNPYELDIAARINEIITYCGFSIRKITYPQDIRSNILTAAQYIREQAGLEDTEIDTADDDTYSKTQNMLNMAINVLQVNTLSLQKVLQAQQVTNMLQTMQMNQMYELIKTLSSNYALLADEFDMLKSSMSGMS